MSDFLKNLKTNIDDQQPSYKLERDLEKNLSLHTDGNFRLADHGKQVGHSERVPEGVRYVDRPSRGGERISADGALGDLEKDIKRTVEKKERAEAKLTKYTDTSKGNGLAAKREVESHDRTLKLAGEKAQRHIADTTKDLERYKEGLIEAHDRTIDGLIERKDTLHDAISAIEHDKKTNNLVVPAKDIGDHVVKVKIGKDEFEINKSGVSKNGSVVNKLEQEELKDLQRAAKSAVTDHIDAHKNVLERAHDKATGIIDDKVAHLEGMKSDISTKTGIGEWTGKSASAVTAGGAKAGNLMSAATYEKATGWQKFKAETGANFGAKGGTGAKFLRVIGTGAGAILVLDGAKNLLRGIGVLSPKTDETGKEIPAGGGDIIKGLGEVGGGGVVAYLSLAAGGKGKIMGK
jgi:hypothetical protein